jgi:hypothetical protein
MLCNSYGQALLEPAGRLRTMPQFVWEVCHAESLTDNIVAGEGAGVVNWVRHAPQ